MGQQQQAITKVLPDLQNLFYELDMRLLQKVQNIPSSFPSDIEEIISQAEQFYLKEPHHFLIDFLISQINARFNSMSINKEAMSEVGKNLTIMEIFQVSPIFLKLQKWYELQTADRFLKYLQKVQEQYWIEQQLYDILQKDESPTTSNWLIRSRTPSHHQSQYKSTTTQPSPHHSLSIRKQLTPITTSPTYKPQLRQPLFKKLFFYYYFQLIRMFCSSRNNSQRANAVEFHTRVGRNILKMVRAEYVSQEKLFGLLYEVVKIQKTTKSLLELQAVAQEYQSECLRHQYSITIEKQKLQKIKLLTKCYLDEMYFLAIKEAEDPEIIEDDMTIDSGLMLKNFPINRVKQKNRNM